VRKVRILLSFQKPWANELTSLDYLFQLAVEMKKLGLPWLSDIGGSDSKQVPAPASLDPAVDQAKNENSQKLRAF
jgi:hypothetical protein